MIIHLFQTTGRMLSTRNETETETSSFTIFETCGMFFTIQKILSFLLSVLWVKS